MIISIGTAHFGEAPVVPSFFNILESTQRACGCGKCGMLNHEFVGEIPDDKWEELQKWIEPYDELNSTSVCSLDILNGSTP